MADFEEHSASLQFDLDGHSLPKGIAVRRAPGVSVDVMEQPRGEKEQLKRT